MQTTHTCHVYGDDINTDLIFAGKYTYTLRSQEEIAAHALEDLDSAFVGRVRRGDVIVAGRNWGCGSSREQAVTALKWAGIVAIIAESFGGLYFRNCINQGIRPIVLAGANRMVRTGDTLTLDHAAQTIMLGGQTFALPPLSPSVQAIIDAGGLIPMLKARYAKA